MKKWNLLLLFCFIFWGASAQQVMTPELLWKLGRVSFVAQNPHQSQVIYKVAYYDLATQKSKSTYYITDWTNANPKLIHFLDQAQLIQWDENGIYIIRDNAIQLSKDEGKTWQFIAKAPEDAMDIRIAPDGKWMAFSKTVLEEKVMGNQIHADMPQTSAKIYNSLDYKHWDTYNDGTYNHVFVQSLENTNAPAKDILAGTTFNTPQKPFGGAEDFIFSPDAKTLVYVCKKKSGTAYAISTNTDLYQYDLNTGITTNLTQGMMGYDQAPQFNKTGTHLAWLSMKRDGYEADKNDLVVMDMKTKEKTNLTAAFDMTIDGGFYWSGDDKTIFYNATREATNQLFWTDIRKAQAPVKWTDGQITSGQHDITGIYADNRQSIVVSRTDMNHASELFVVDKSTGKMKALTHVNDEIYNSIALSDVKMRIVKTTHGKDMGVWVIYPPNFDPNKKYPTLLYCQGGPQGAVSQFYSFRWNFQLMAAKGYIVVAPNRTGLPGYGVAWNEDISGDWGGQPMKDYLAAIDDVAREPFVDKSRLGAVGASYGGYSVFMLAGIHEGRFKTFISHCGLFDMRSWYGTTEELWFANWDLGGNYWQENPPKAYTQFDPSSFVKNWNTPILIFQGEKDFRVPIGQGEEAFQAAQLKGIKSRLILYPDENHWILKPQNAMVWHREFFKWLEETL